MTRIGSNIFARKYDSFSDIYGQGLEEKLDVRV